MSIKVIAYRQGYYGHFREVGDVFEVEDKEAFHDSWMERVDAKSTKRVATELANSTGNNPMGAKPRSTMNDLPDLA